MSMIRVLQVIKFADNSGAPRHVLALLRNSRGKYDGQLCVGVDDPQLSAYERAGTVIHRLDALGGSASPLQFVQALLAVTRLLRKAKPDVVHVHSPLAGTIVRLAAAYLRIPCLFTAHGWNFAPGLPPRRRAISWLLEFTTARLGQPIIVVSEYDRQLARRYAVARAPQVRCIFNGIPDHPASPRTGSDEPPVIVMVARFSDQKRQVDLVNALALMKTHAQVWLVGDGPTRPQCEAMTRTLRLEQSVRFWGEQAEVAGILAEADIFVLATNFEGLPLAVLEAMRAQLPVAASRVGGIPDAVAHGVSGLLHERGDTTALAAHLDMLVADPALRTRMGMAGRQRFLARFTEERMIERTFSLYAQLSTSVRGKS